MSHLSMWVVTDHPIDFPDMYVARRHEISRFHAGETDDLLMSSDLYRLRQKLADRGLVRLDRSLEDDPVVLEVWL